MKTRIAAMSKSDLDDVCRAAVRLGRDVTLEARLEARLIAFSPAIYPRAELVERQYNHG